MSDFQTVCQIADVPVGQSRMFQIGDQFVGLFNVNGEFLAVNNECPHAGASLAHGTVDGTTVACRIHHWRFCLKTGRYLDEDQPKYNAQTFATRIVDGDVQVSVEPIERS